mgnify:CR=1 FL=1
MKKAALLFNVFLMLGLLMTTSTKAALAGPHQSFSPSSGTYTVGEEFSVTVKMDSGSQVVGGADGYGTYDSKILELVSVEEAPSLVFETTDDGGSCSVSDPESGKFSYSCYSNSNSSSNSNNGDLVVFNFKAKAVGTGLVKFNCTQGSTTDTNIIKASPVGEIIVCSENVNGSYVVKAGDGDDDTSDTTEETEEETEELPKTGAIGATLGLILFGAVSVVSAVVLKFL